MIILVEARWFRSPDHGMPQDSWEGIELHAGWPRPYGYWYIDRRSLRPRGWGYHYAVPAGHIDGFAAVRHGTRSCTLLLLSRSLIHTRRLTPTRPYDQRKPEYLELGTIFNAGEGQKMIDGLWRLEYRVAEYTWPGFLETLAAAAVRDSNPPATA